MEVCAQIPVPYAHTFAHTFPRTPRPEAIVSGENPSLAGIRASTEGGSTSLAHLVELLVRPAWHADAACREHPGLSWFPPRGDYRAANAALEVCAACLVRAECLEFALARPDSAGLWGGTTARQRAAIARQHGRPAPPTGPSKPDHRTTQWRNLK